MNWPENAAFGLTVTIDVDGDLPFLAQDPANIDRHKSRSTGLYGPDEGAARLLNLMDELGLTTTWFIPGQIAERYSDLVRRIKSSGHEIAVHGHRHLDFDGIELEEQVSEILNGRDAIFDITGESPEGFRTPAGEWAPEFPEAMAKAGFTWSSSLISADDVPFSLSGTPLVEIPPRYDLEDLQYLGYNLEPPFPPGQSRITPLEIVEENWQIEVDGAARYGTLFHLRLNAEVMGFPGRTHMLRRFLTSVLARGDVWAGTCSEIAHFARQIPDDPQHPYAIFLRFASEVSR